MFFITAVVKMSLPQFSPFTETLFDLFEKLHFFTIAVVKRYTPNYLFSKNFNILLYTPRGVKNGTPFFRLI